MIKFMTFSSKSDLIFCYEMFEQLSNFQFVNVFLSCKSNSSNYSREENSKAIIEKYREKVTPVL